MYTYAVCYSWFQFHTVGGNNYQLSKMDNVIIKLSSKIDNEKTYWELVQQCRKDFIANHQSKIFNTEFCAVVSFTELCHD